MNKSESIGKLAEALSKAQGEMKNPAFDMDNPYFKSKYASLAAVRDAAMPILSKYGVAITQLLCDSDKIIEGTFEKKDKDTGKPYLVEKKMPTISVETILLHVSGEWISTVLTLPVSEPTAQGFSSAATYSKRIGMQGILGIVGDTDDDANEASGKTAKPNNLPELTPPKKKEIAEEPKYAPGEAVPTLTEEQQKVIFAILKGKGMTKSQAKIWLKSFFGYDSLAQVRVDQLDEVSLKAEMYVGA